MTITIRARFSKGSNVRYISHLDLQRMFGRALRRAKVPIAYSQGFNPHPKLSFGSALGVGTTSESEFLDIELSETMSPDEFAERINNILPEGFSIHEAHVYETEVGNTKIKTLMSVINTAEYEINAYPISDADPIAADAFQVQLQEALHKINKCESWTIVRFSKKKERELDIKPFVYQIEYKREADKIVVIAIVKSGSEANVRPDEIMEVLRKFGELPEAPYQIHRKNLGIMEEQRIVKPFLT